jgi:hypothetical protein
MGCSNTVVWKAETKRWGITTNPLNSKPQTRGKRRIDVSTANSDATPREHLSRVR